MDTWIIDGRVVHSLGYGAGPYGAESLPEESAAALTQFLRNSGTNLFDTARGYGLSEERLGRYLDPEALVCTKLGYGVSGTPDWSYEAVRRGAEEARRKLRRQTIDILLLHSCSVEDLRWGEALRALHDEKASGGARLIGYSGDNEPLIFAIEHGALDVVMTSLNLTDQACLERAIPLARQKGVRVLAKRPLANAPWRYAELPAGQYVEEYWRRFQTLGIQPTDFETRTWEELFLRFALGFADAVVAGTTRPDHWSQLQTAVSAGPLPERHLEDLRSLYRRKNPGWWVGQV